MVGEPSHVKQLSLNHVCKIGLSKNVLPCFAEIGLKREYWTAKKVKLLHWSRNTVNFYISIRSAIMALNILTQKSLAFLVLLYKWCQRIPVTRYRNFLNLYYYTYFCTKNAGLLALSKSLHPYSGERKYKSRHPKSLHYSIPALLMTLSSVHCVLGINKYGSGLVWTRNF